MEHGNNELANAAVVVSPTSIYSCVLVSVSMSVLCSNTIKALPACLVRAINLVLIVQRASIKGGANARPNLGQSLRSCPIQPQVAVVFFLPLSSMLVNAVPWRAKKPTFMAPSLASARLRVLSGDDGCRFAASHALCHIPHQQVPVPAKIEERV